MMAVLHLEQSSLGSPVVGPSTPLGVDSIVSLFQ